MHFSRETNALAKVYPTYSSSGVGKIKSTDLIVE